MAATEKEKLLYMVHHVFLPPALPSNGDDDSEAVKNTVLLEHLSKALGKFQAFVDEHSASDVLSVQAMIDNMSRLTHSSGFISQTKLLRALQTLGREGEYFSLTPPSWPV